jgi:uroporphyrinogen-III synthase
MSEGVLKGLTVLMTRPQAQSEKAAMAIIEQGGNPIIFPTLEIVPAEPKGGWSSLVQKLKSIDIAVFTSANAVQQLMAQKLPIETHCTFAAIGAATQSALRESGISCDWIPMKDYRSEGLLELPVFQDVRAKKIILFACEGGREYLQDVLEQRGAQVEKVAVYNRECPKVDPAVLKQFFAQTEPKIVVSTSVQSLKNLLELSSEIGHVKELSLLVISQRMKDAAHVEGFQKIFMAENASNEAIVWALSLYIKKHRG